MTATAVRSQHPPPPLLLSTTVTTVTAAATAATTPPPLPTVLSASPVPCAERGASSKAVPLMAARSGRMGADGERLFKLKTEN